MAQTQARNPAPLRRTSRKRPEFIAAVRFRDGERQLFSVSNADNSQIARQMVLDELRHVAAVVVALR